MTRYIAAYDTESAKCPVACEKIAAVHREFDMPATFFIVGRHLLEHADFYRTLLDDPLFEIGSHTWTHGMLKDHPICGQARTGQALVDEVCEGKKAVERVFDRACAGLRPACSFDDALHDAPRVLELVRQAGYQYVSSQAWGPRYTLPAPLNQPHTYEADGHPDLWELPCHGWHDNVLTGPMKQRENPFTVAWPIEDPQLVPTHPVETPEQEAAVYRRLIDCAVQQQVTFVSPIWHPWSLDRFDPDMRMIREVFTHVKELGLETDTYHGLHEACSGGS